MTTTKLYQVKELAQLSGLSVRTLHHYDKLGLVRPSARSAAGYRLYDQAALLRLQQVLVYRALGLPLAQIQRVLDAPDYDTAAALRRQRHKLSQEVARTERMLAAIDRALSLYGKEPAMPLSENDAKQLFDGFNPADYEAETQQRWGATEAYAVSKQRTAGYTKAEYTQIKEQQQHIYESLMQLKTQGVDASDSRAVAIAEEHRRFIDHWFYPCSKDQHCGLADLYEADDRFRQNIDKYGEELTPYLSAAIRHNADASA